MKIAAARSFDDTARFRVTVPARLPAVTRRTRFDFRIRGRSEGESAWRLAGHQISEVHPRGIMSKLSDVRKTRLFVLNDHDAELTSFLDSEGIPFKVLSGVALTELPPNRVANRTAPAGTEAETRLVLHVPSPETDDRPVGTNEQNLDALLRKGFRVIQFREKVGTVPVVFIHQIAPGVRADIEMRLIDSLATTPRAQLFLLDVVWLAIEDGQP